MSALFSPIQFRDLKIKNRVFMSPMCQYSAVEGVAQSWHLAHLGSRAVGGVGLIITEAAAVSPEGRISPADLGLWNEQQALALNPILNFIKSEGAAVGVQLAHAGRKAGTDLPWNGGAPLTLQTGAWPVIGPTAIAFDKNYQTPEELSPSGIKKIVDDFVHSTKLSLLAGFQLIELHMAHGYLLHQFLSPLSNKRKDDFGGTLENRMRLPILVCKAVREVWPKELPLFVRISATDWAEGGWDLQQSLAFCEQLKKIGVDLVDVSSGGLVPHVKIPVAPNYQVHFAEEIKKKINIPTGAVGLITEARQANAIIESGQADAVLLARELLRNPYWPNLAAQELGDHFTVPVQYARA